MHKNKRPKTPKQKTQIESNTIKQMRTIGTVSEVSDLFGSVGCWAVGRESDRVVSGMTAFHAFAFIVVST